MQFSVVFPASPHATAAAAPTGSASAAVPAVPVRAPRRPIIVSPAELRSKVALFCKILKVLLIECITL